MGYPAISKALASACERLGARLVCFDNVYFYWPAPLPVPFDENTPRDPPSRKGNARRRAVEIVMEAHRAGRIRATVGRATNFYGPRAVNSPFYISFLERMLDGRVPQVAMPEGHVHTYAYTSGNGRGLVALALAEDAYGEEFHLPFGPPVKVWEMAALLNAQIGTSYSVHHIPDIALRGLALFRPLIRDVYEMSYQYRTDYVMSDAKFLGRFPDFVSTSYEDGVSTMVDHFRQCT